MPTLACFYKDKQKIVSKLPDTQMVVLYHPLPYAGHLSTKTDFSPYGFFKTLLAAVSNWNHCVLTAVRQSWIIRWGLCWQSKGKNTHKKNINGHKTSANGSALARCARRQVCSVGARWTGARWGSSGRLREFWLGSTAHGPTGGRGGSDRVRGAEWGAERPVWREAWQILWSTLGVLVFSHLY